MTEQREQQNDSPLVGERGSTLISDSVVATIAGRAAGEVPGIHMGGGASRTVGGILGGVTGSQGTSRGVSVEVGTTETALDLTMGVEYGRDILETVEAVRRGITERVEYMTGLKVTELNVTVNDIVSPEENGGDKRRGGSSSEAASEPETRTMPRGELRPGAQQRESTRVSPSSRTRSESQSGPVPEEPVRAEGSPVGQDETVEIRPGDVADAEKSSSSEEETRATRRQRREEQNQRDR